MYEIKLKPEFRDVKGLLNGAYQIQIPLFLDNDVSFKRIHLSSNGMLHIEDAYAWDYASGAFDTTSIIEGSLVHDSLSELMFNGLINLDRWDLCADIMYEINRLPRNHMFKWRAKWICKAIKLAGPSVLEARIYRTF